MSTPKKHTGSFAELFESADSRTQLTESDAGEILKDAGLDGSASLKRLLAAFDAVDSRERSERFAKAEIAARTERERLAGKSSTLSRPELIAQLDLYRKQHPQLSGHFRNFQSVSDEELRSLVAEIEELVSGATKK